MTRTFAVSQVETVRTPLEPIAGAELLRRHGFRGIEAHGLDATSWLPQPMINPLVAAFDLAFNKHRPLALGPDEVWLCIAQGLALHVNANADQLRARLARHEGKLLLDVRRDDLVPGRDDNDWPGAIATLVAAVRAQLGGRADLFLADFSTSTAVTRTASAVMLLDAMQCLFEYRIGSLCGIPEVTLHGTPEDWANLRRRARVFGELGLEAYAQSLDGVLARIENTARGEIDVEFWRRAYKLEHMSGGNEFHGWINAFFPYVQRTGAPLKPNHWALFPDYFEATDPDGYEDDPEEDDDDDDDDTPFLCIGNRPGDIPLGLARASFTWHLPTEDRAMQLVGGLVGVTQDATGTLAARAGWLVVPEQPPSPFIIEPGSEKWPSTLRPRSPQTLTSLALLSLHADIGMAMVRCYECPELRSIDGIEHLAVVIGLELVNCTALTSLAPLAHRRRLTQLDLEGCTALTDLAPLATLTDLVSLSLLNCTQFKSPRELLPIAELPRLRALELGNCPALPLELRHPERTREAVAAVQQYLRDHA